MKRVTGIGGIFFKTPDPQATKEWYGKHLGLPITQWGASFVTRQVEDPDQNAYLEWSPMAQDTDYFSPSDQPFMINYRVEDLVALVAILKTEGVTICDEITTYDYGKFVHIMDPFGNKIELWEPIDKVFDELFDKK